jgi:hypothetical protein
MTPGPTAADSGGVMRVTVSSSAGHKIPATVGFTSNPKSYSDAKFDLSGSKLRDTCDLCYVFVKFK